MKEFDLRKILETHLHPHDLKLNVVGLDQIGSGAIITEALVKNRIAVPYSCGFGDTGSLVVRLSCEDICAIEKSRLA